MIYQVEILDEVFYDIEETIVYYDLHVLGLGVRFYKEFQETVGLISRNPNLFNKKRKNYRQIKMKNFPFLIVFEIENNKIIVSRLFHAKRNPKDKFKY